MSTKQLVRVSEIADELGSGPVAIYWLDAVGARVQEDWRGDAAVTSEDAAKALDAFKRNEAAHAEKQRAYEAYLQNAMLNVAVLARRPGRRPVESSLSARRRR